MMKRRKVVFLIGFIMLLSVKVNAQNVQPYIKIDQFGYRPGDNKIAVIADPQIGYNAADEFVPGVTYQVRKKTDNSVVFEGTPKIWNLGNISSQSGDKGWWFDFSEVTDTGSFYIYDVTKDVRSYYFEINQDIYTNMLKAAVKMFYYQRLGIEKDPKYAGEFNDGYQLPMDSVCSDIHDKSNPAKIIDMRGGWMDAGDQNKYVTFAIEPVNQLLSAYEQNPDVFTDDFNIPESGNGIPDIIDEVKWEIDWLKRMQDSTDGGAYLKMGGQTSKPFSQDINPKYYFSPKSSAANIDITCMLAHAYLVFNEFPELKDYANDCKKRALKGWEYFTNNPMNFNIDDGSLGGGDADRNEGTQKADALTAAIYLYAATGEDRFHTHVINNYTNPGDWGIYNNHRSRAFLYYAFLPNANKDLSMKILFDKVASYTNNAGGWTKWDATKDLYGSYMPDAQYHWGSNQPKANVGNALSHFLNYYILPDEYNTIKNHALNFIHYFHGVNPVGYTYLTNMEQFGGDNCTKYAWHNWFNPNPCPPGYIPGGPNSSYKPDASFGGILAPPQNQPPQKSYKDWAKTWPDKAWEVTEPAIYYQGAYVYLVSNFVGASDTSKVEADSLDIFHNSSDTLFESVNKMLYVRIYPLEAYKTKLTWLSSDTSIATIDSTGTISPKKEGTVIIKVIAENGVSDSVTVNIKTCSSAPYKGTPAPIPGIIESEEFDKGCYIYFDTDPTNSGGQFRTNEGVDIELNKDDRGLYDVGWINEGEWGKYTVEVKEPGAYIVECRVATMKESKMMIEFSDGAAFSQPIIFPNSSGYQNWFSFYTEPIQLTLGVKTMTVTYLTDGYNVNHLKFHKYVPVNGIAVTTDTLRLFVNEADTLTAEIDGDEGVIKDVVWSSSEPTIATVNKNGIVKAIKPGMAYAKVVTKVGGLSDSTVVIVSEKVSLINKHTSPDFLIFPNPVINGYLSIQLSDNAYENIKLSIADISGKIVYETTIDYVLNGRIDINTEIENGIYFLNITGSEFKHSRLVVFSGN